MDTSSFRQSQFSTPIEGPRVEPPHSFLPPFRRQEASIKKVSFATSQFSGPLSYGGFNQVSSVPPFVQPPVEVKAVASGGVGGLPHPASQSPKTKVAAPGFGTIVGAGAGTRTAVQKLSITKKVGTPQVTPPPGPSVAQISKPVNFGKGSATGPTLPAAGKVP